MTRSLSICTSPSTHHAPRAAVKLMEKSKLTAEDKAALTIEVEAMKRLSDHDSFVKLYEFFDEADKYMLVIELISGGELFDRIVEKEKYTEREARRVIKQLTEAMSYSHSKGIAHRDLKPENVLLRDKNDDTSIKIADFGFAKIITEGELMKTPCGCVTPARRTPASRRHPRPTTPPPARRRAAALPHSRRCSRVPPLTRARALTLTQHARLRRSRDSLRQAVRPRGRHLVAGRHFLHPALGLPALCRRRPEAPVRADQGRQLQLQRPRVGQHLGACQGPRFEGARCRPCHASDGEADPQPPVGDGRRPAHPRHGPLGHQGAAEALPGSAQAQEGHHRHPLDHPHARDDEGKRR